MFSLGLSSPGSRFAAEAPSMGPYFVTPRFEEAVRWEEDNGNDASVAPRRMLHN